MYVLGLFITRQNKGSEACRYCVVASMRSTPHEANYRRAKWMALEWDAKRGTIGLSGLSGLLGLRK